jgi:hypothetical protein
MSQNGVFQIEEGNKDKFQNLSGGGGHNVGNRQKQIAIAKNGYVLL